MAFNFLKNKSLWMNVLFYFFSALLAASVFSYFILAFKIYFQNQRISEIDSKIAIYGTDQQKTDEKQVLDYKKKVDDFSIIINNHKISSNIFTFIEEKTLPNVWFSDFAISESKNELRLLGESENMEILSSQVNVFEGSKDYIKNIDVLNSQVSSTGKINFTLNLSLDPKVFSYMSPSSANASENSSNNQ